MMISIETKLFEEVDKPEKSKIISQKGSDGITIRESSWSGQIMGFNQFPSGTVYGSGTSKIFENGISISDWEGVFKTTSGHEVTFIGKDVSKDGKFFVLRTFLSKDEEFEWMNGLVCILDGKHDLEHNSFVCTGYKLM